MRRLRIVIILAALFAGGCASLLASVSHNDPLTAEEHNNLGVIYEREGKYDLALREYEAASDKDGSLVVPLVNTGNIYLKEGEYEKAEKYYGKALEKDGANLEAANNLASLYLEQGRNYAEGLEALKRAVKDSDPVPAYALDTLGVLYFRLGYGEEALKYLSSACESADDNQALRGEIDVHMKEIDRDAGCM